MTSTRYQAQPYYDRECPHCHETIVAQGWFNHVRGCTHAPVYCDCLVPTPGWGGVECGACYRLIEGSIGRVIGELAR